MLKEQKTIPAVPINGWDVVYSCRFSDVNKAIVAKGTTPSSFSYDFKDEDGTIYSLTGKFDPWSLIPGGDGHLVHLNVPAKNVVFEITDPPPPPPPSKPSASNVPQYNLKLGDIDDNILIPFATISIEIQLDWLSESSKNDQVKHLKVSDKRDNVFLIKEDYGGTKIPLPYKSLISDLFLGMLKQHLDYFQHIFATLDYTQTFDDQFRWLKPTDHEYSVSTINDADGNPIDGFLGTLCMTEGRIPPQSHLMPENIIPDNANTGYCFNQSLFLANMVAPCLTNLFPDSYTNDFTIASNGTIISNNNKVSFKEMASEGGKVHRAQNVTPSVEAEGFKMSLLGGELYITITQASYLMKDVETDYQIFLSHTSKHGVTLTKEGRLSISVDSDNKPTITSAPVEHKKTAWQNILSFAEDMGVQLAFMGAGVYMAKISQIGIKAIGAATDAAEVAAGTAEKTALTEVEIAEEEIAQAVQETIEEDVEQVAESEISNNAIKDVASKEGRVKRLLTGSMANMVLTVLYTTGLQHGISFLEYAEKKDFTKSENIPTLDDLYKQIHIPMTWPNQEKEGFAIVDGQLTDGSFRIGINVNFSS